MLFLSAPNEVETSSRRAASARILWGRKPRTSDFEPRLQLHGFPCVKVLLRNLDGKFIECTIGKVALADITAMDCGTSVVCSRLATTGTSCTIHHGYIEKNSSWICVYELMSWKNHTHEVGMIIPCGSIRRSRKMQTTTPPTQICSNWYPNIQIILSFSNECLGVRHIFHVWVLIRGTVSISRSITMFSTVLLRTNRVDVWIHHGHVRAYCGSDVTPDFTLRTCVHLSRPPKSPPWIYRVKKFHWVAPPPFLTQVRNGIAARHQNWQCGRVGATLRISQNPSVQNEE